MHFSWEIQIIGNQAVMSLVNPGKGGKIGGKGGKGGRGKGANDKHQTHSETETTGREEETPWEKDIKAERKKGAGSKVPAGFAMILDTVRTSVHRRTKDPSTD